MNLVTFLKKVDDIISEMTKEQLQSYVHELARTLPESRRPYFLEIMEEVQKDAGSLKVRSDRQHKEIEAGLKEIKEILTDINAGERCLDSEYNQAWDDWYNSSVDEFLFSDPEGLLKDIEKAIDLLHKCVDMELYQSGYELAEILSVLEVSVTGDYCDCVGEPLEIGELYEHNLLNGALKNLVRESLYLAYMGNELSFKAEELYCMIENYRCYDVTLEDVMQDGKQELPQFKEFLLLWIEYLGHQNGRGVKALLQEAQMMLEDEDQLLEIARKFIEQHPELYKQLLQRGMENGAWEKMFVIGSEALEKIPVSYVLRSDIALLTAECAGRLEDHASAEICWIEAFRSDTSVINYMRIRFMTENWEQHREKVKQIYEDMYEQLQLNSNQTMGSAYPNMQRLNSLYQKTYYTLLFFEGEYEKVIGLGLSERKALGWSSTFMKEGLALFLLLLYKGDGLSKGCVSMLERVIAACGFQTDKFFKGTCLEQINNESEYFWKLFCKWKNEVEISERDVFTWLKIIENYIELRTEGIMDANRRNYYGECAEFIAAYGEVCESRGIVGAKAKIMERYRAKYSRRRAFHQELKNYGMR